MWQAGFASAKWPETRAGYAFALAWPAASAARDLKKPSGTRGEQEKNRDALDKNLVSDYTLYKSAIGFIEHYS